MGASQADCGWTLTAACRRTFYSHSTSTQALDVNLYAGPAELQALMRTFGVHAARELGQHCVAPLRDAVTRLDAVLREHEPLLQRLKMEYLVGVTTCFTPYKPTAPNPCLSQDFEEC